MATEHPLDMKNNSYFELNDGPGMVEIDRTVYAKALKAKDKSVPCVFLQRTEAAGKSSYHLSDKHPNEVEMSKLKAVVIGMDGEDFRKTF